MKFIAQMIGQTVQTNNLASLANEVSSEITRAQVAEVQRRVAQRRVAQVDSGEVTLIPGDEVLAKARALLKERKP